MNTGREHEHRGRVILTDFARSVQQIVERTSAAIIILLLFLLLMNGLAIYLRNRFERKW
jgi:ABC-type phosphate transport system permease subunit